MKNTPLYSLFLIIFMLAAGCAENPEKEKTVSEKTNPDKEVTVTDEHNAANSLDWNGTYKGIVPCADCEGIETEIIINKDNTYSVKTKYLGRSNNAVEEKGSFTWNAAGNTIILSGARNKPHQYFVGENKLIQLDLSGNKITGSLEAKYILAKQ